MGKSLFPPEKDRFQERASLWKRTSLRKKSSLWKRTSLRRKLTAGIYGDFTDPEPSDSASRPYPDRGVDGNEMTTAKL